MPEKKKRKEPKKSQVQVSDLEADKKGKDVKGGAARRTDVAGESLSLNYGK